MFRSRIQSIAIWTLVATGIVAILLTTIGVVADVRAFDPTSGGYEPPYTDYSGEPIDWDERYLTDRGMYSPGYVIDQYVDCTTGMISIETFGLRFDYRELSPRALEVHEPREACEERGFSPQF